MKHETGDFQSADGLRLREQWWLPNGAPKAAVILHHGLWDYSDYYAPFAEELTKHNFTVYAFDIRGHGNSGGDRYFIKSFDEYISDLDVFLKRVQQRATGKPVFLFGHSLGGLISTTYVLANPKNDLRGVIISGAGLKEGHDVTPLLKKIVPILGSIAPKWPSYKPNFNLGSRDKSVVEKKLKDPLIDHKGLPARAGAEGLRAIANAQANMEKFSAPVLIMHGTEDHWTNSEGSQQLAKRASSKDKTLKMYDGFYHELLTDTNKAVVWNDIIAWMDARI
jgi:alpha-beta hydrolase superfamily lysophospholipase